VGATMRRIRLKRVPTAHMLLSLAEVAELLRTYRKAVSAMAVRGQVPGVRRLGRRVLFRSDLVLEWLRNDSEPL
jgi:excisionase family DNA binding protein